MLRRSSCALCSALLLTLLPGAAARAAMPAAPASEFARPIPEVLGPSVAAPASDGRASEFASEFVRRRPAEPSSPDAGSDLPPGHPDIYAHPTTLEAVSFQPRRAPSHPPSAASHWRGVSQLHAGFLDPDGPSDVGFDMGFRAGHEIDQMFQLGVGLDWRTKSGNTTSLAHSSLGPGGETIVTQLEAAHFSSNLLPVLAYAQLSGPARRIVPYVGIAGSWQVLFLQADDYATGQRFDATYNGWGWQAWGGAGITMVGRTRLIGEVFMNQGNVGRDVFDPFYGAVVRETISTDGFGARFGVSWGF
jgi:hypothetical protein